MYCNNCGANIPDGSAVCPYCAASTAPSVNSQSPYGESQYGQSQYGQTQYQQPQYGQPQYGQPQYQQPQYGQPQYGQPQYQQYGFQQPYGAPIYNEKDISNSKTLGILSIIFGFFSPLIGWILGGIGMSKTKNVLAIAPGQPEAESANKLCLAGVIVSTASFVLAVIMMLVNN